MKASGKRYKFRKYEFWASCGMIAILDTEAAGGDQRSVEDATKWVRPAEFLENAMAARSLIRDPWEGRRMLEAAQQCVKEAVQQGDIYDPTKFRQMLDESRPVIVSTVGLAIPQRTACERYIEQFRKLRQNKKATVEDVFVNGYRKYLEVDA